MKDYKKANKSTDNNGYFDDCPICQAMKKRGIKMQYYQDGVKGNGEEGVWEKGFYATLINAYVTG